MLAAMGTRSLRKGGPSLGIDRSSFSQNSAGAITQRQGNHWGLTEEVLAGEAINSLMFITLTCAGSYAEHWR